MDNGPGIKNTKKRKREESVEELEKLIFNQHSKVQILSKPDTQRKLIEQDKNFWETIRKENISEILNKDKTFSFGNYDRYYYRRYLEAFKDPRLNIFQSDWFNNKIVLDIGCNDGTLTILTAVTYQPLRIEGIDVDYGLISRALKNMKYVIRGNLNKNFIESANNFYLNDSAHKEEVNNNINENVNLIDEILQNDNNEKHSEFTIAEKNKGPISNSTTTINQSIQHKNEINLEIKKRLEGSMSSKSNLKEILSKLDTLPKSFLINLGIPQKSLDKKEQLSTISNANNQLYPFNINFKQRNYVSSFRDNSTNKYDTIMCLSTVKWVHLNYGDIGVKLLFYNIYSELKDGGIFIFEPQNWKSYKKRRNLNERIKTNFSNISFRPEQFKTFLEEVYNFKCINKLQPPSNSKKSFDRPIFIFRKELPK